MASTTKLIVWNAALREIASSPLANLTNVNTKQQELSGAWDHAVEYCLALRDWGFARRRSNLTAVADASFPPYTYRFSKPADYLRKCWVKNSAVDDHEVDHAEVAAAFYGLQTTALLEYVSDHADNYDPANWPPHFTRIMTLYLASLVGPKLARAGADDLGRLNGQMTQALEVADGAENAFLTNTAIASERHPVMRRALEFLGQQLAGSVAIHSHTNKLRWHMNQSWDHAVRYVLEQGAWNFAAKRAYFHDGLTGDSLVPSTEGGIIDGYSVEPATAATSTVSISGYDYGYPLPDDFLHKIWIKVTPESEFEIHYQVLGEHIFINEVDAIMEYVAENEFTTNPVNWSANFLEAVAAYLALLVSPELLLETGGKQARVMANDVRNKMEAVWLAKLSSAKNLDAIQQEPKTLPLGRFARARFGGMRTTSLRRLN